MNSFRSRHNENISLEDNAWTRYVRLEMGTCAAIQLDSWDVAKLWHVSSGSMKYGKRLENPAVPAWGDASPRYDLILTDSYSDGSGRTLLARVSSQHCAPRRRAYRCGNEKCGRIARAGEDTS